MSWRTGSTLFLEIWPLIQDRIPEQDIRIDFTAEIVKAFVRGDMDTWEVEDVDPEIRAAIKLAGFELAEPERWTDDPDLKG